MKIRPMGAELHADGQMDRLMKLLAAFRNFANAPKKRVMHLCNYL